MTHQIGIVSTGLECKSQEHPGIYARVEVGIDFIEWETRDAGCDIRFDRGWRKRKRRRRRNV